MDGGAGWLLTPALAFLVAAGAPGPATLSAAAVSAARGRVAGLVHGAGLTLGLAMWGALVAAGLGAVVLGSPPALLALRIAGAAFLLYLAIGSARAAMRRNAPHLDASAAGASLPRLFLRGAALNALNPKAALAWAAVIALGLPAEGGEGRVAVIVAVCAVLGAAVYAACALAFSTQAVMRGWRRARRWIEAALAVVFAGAALRLAVGRLADAP